MILEIVGGAIMSVLLGYTVLDKHAASEGSKIQRIANNCGLVVREDGKQRTIHLLRRHRHSWGTEYVYRLPLGLSFEDVQRKQQTIEDGLNNKRGLLDLSLSDLKRIELRTDIVEQIKQLLSGTKHRKEVVMDYDGALRIRVYHEPMPAFVPFDDGTLESCKGWKVCAGQSREGTIYHDFETIPHLVVAGTTRYGKSVYLKNVITTLIHIQPAAARLTLIDLKGGLAFNRFAQARQVETVAKDAGEALEALRDIHATMKQRQASFLAKGVEDVREARQKHRDFIIIDEAAELASQGETDKEAKKVKAECEHIIAEIARIGGGLGYRLIFATQYPTADTLPRQVKQNCDARLCFRLQTEVASRVVLDDAGAETLPYIKGRAIYQTDRRQIVQTPYIENDFIDRTIRPHITIKPRKEQQHGEPAKEASTRGSYTLIVEET